MISGASSQNDPRASSSRSRTAGKKEDIFATHNRNVKKRALKDLDPDPSSAFDQKHSTSSEALDSSTWHRSKRKMEEKARLYNAMKKGHIDNDDEKHMVDFDQKWIDEQDKSVHSSSDEESDADKELVEWEDEFGRTRTGTRTQRAREQRMNQLQEETAMRSRPSMPSNIIYGDTVQAAAFNPDESIAQHMAELAAKRDKSATPPPDTHFDSSKEIRQKGVGFFQFSLDDDERRKQFSNLEREREETERIRKEREKRLNDRKDEIEKRRKAIRERRGKKQATDFLSGLDAELSTKDNQNQSGQDSSISQGN